MPTTLSGPVAVGAARVDGRRAVPTATALRAYLHQAGEREVAGLFAVGDAAE